MTRMNNASLFESRNETPSYIQGVKNKWSYPGELLIWARAVIRLVYRESQENRRPIAVPGTRGGLSTCAPSIPGQYTRVTPKSFSSGYDSLLYAPRGPPS